MPTPTEVGLSLAPDDGSTFVNLAADINAEFTKVAAHLGITPVTSATRPTTELYLGRLISESDTGRVLRYVGGGTPWKDLGDVKVIVGAVGTAAPASFETTSTIAGNRLLQGKKNGETNQGFILDFDGKMQWGPGGATVPDVNLYRSAPGVLKTDQDIMAGSASVRLATISRGVVGWGQVTTSSTAGTTTSAMRVDNVSLLAGRLYRIYTNGLYLFGSVSGNTYTGSIRFNTSGTATTGSPQLPGAATEGTFENGGGTGGHNRIETTYAPASNVTASFLLMATVSTGAGTVQIYGDATNPPQITIEDIGPAIANGAVDL